MEFPATVLGDRGEDSNHPELLLPMHKHLSNCGLAVQSGGYLSPDNRHAGFPFFETAAFLQGEATDREVSRSYPGEDEHMLVCGPAGQTICCICRHACYCVQSLNLSQISFIEPFV